MALPARFDKHMKRSFGARAVWQSGQPVSLGTICVKDGGIFRPIDHIDSFGGTFTAKAFTDKSVSLQSSAVRQVIIQAGAELSSADALDLTAKATVKFMFEKAEQYVLKTPQLQGEVIEKIAPLTRKMAKHKDWKHSKFAIVCEIFHARDFTFLATESKQSSIQFSGDGTNVLQLLNLGISTGLRKSGSVELELKGGGPVAMNLVAAKKNGSPNFL